MSLETRLRNTGQQGGGAGGGSAGLVGTGVTIDTTAPLSGGGNLSANRTLTIAGLSNQGLAAQIVGVNGAADAWSYHTIVSQLGMDIGTNDAQYLFKVNTSQIFSDIVYPLTGRYYLTTSVDTLLGSSLVIVPGSSMTHHITGSNYYLNALTGGGSSVVYAPTGGPYLAFNSDATLTAEKVLLPGSSVTVHSDGTFFYINAITGAAAAASGGLAGTGLYYLGTSANGAFPNWLVVQPGSSATHHITGSNYYINAITSLFAGSSGLAGKDAVYVLSSFNAEYTNAVYIRPGSSITTHITGSNLFINAVTSLGASSSGLAGKDAVYVLSSFDAEYTNAMYIKPGSSVTTHITGSNLYINATTGGGAASVERDILSFANYKTEYISGGDVFYGGPGRLTGRTNNTRILGINSLHVFPFIVTRALSVDFMAVDVGSVSSTSLIRLAIYTNSADGVLYPFSLVQTTSIITSGLAVTMSASIAQVLSANSIYWFGIILGTANNSVWGSSTEADTFPLLGYGALTPLGGSAARTLAGYVVANVFSDNLPTTFPVTSISTLNLAAAETTAFIGVRIVSFV